MGLFGPAGSGGEALLGAAGFGGSIGNGFSNEGGREPSFDMSDFPSLGGGVAGTVGSAPGGDNGLAAALRQQQQLLQQQMMQQGAVAAGAGGANVNVNSKSSNLYRLAMSSNIGNGASSNFSMTTEDFPALPGAPPPSSVGSGSGFLTGTDGSVTVSEGSTGASPAPSFLNPQGSVSRETSKSGSLYSGDLDNGGNQLDYTGLLGGVAGLGNVGANSANGNPGSTALSQTRTANSTAQPGNGGGVPTSSGGTGNAGSALSGDFGLLGLLSVIRMTDADRNRLALGSDLTSLGMNLNSSENLYSSFGGPFSDKPAPREPHYQLPMCYYMQPPALKTGHLSKFQLETLFYIFYALPKDVLQAYAAQELYTREWRYHIDSKLWFKRGSPSDGVANNNSGAVQYIYFDINTWERRMYSNVNQNIAGGFLAEEDVRVKFPSS